MLAETKPIVRPLNKFRLKGERYARIIYYRVIDLAFWKKARKNMPIGQLGMMAAGAALDTAMGMATAGWADKRQRKQQQKLQEMQIKGQKEVTDYNMSKQMEMWRGTSYSAQKREMEKAGLNPGLMYGMGGGGGQTANVTSGNVSGGSAPVGGGEIRTGMGIERMMAAAQIENMKADTEKKKAETAKTAGVDTELGFKQVDSLTQGIENAKAAEELTRIQGEIAKVQASVSRQTINEQMEAWENVVKKGAQEIKMLGLSNELSNLQMMDKVKLLAAEVSGQLLENSLTEQQTEESKSKITKMIAEVKQGWKGLDLQEIRVNVEKFAAEMRANFPGLGQALGRVINGAFEQLTGGLPEGYKVKEK